MKAGSFHKIPLGVSQFTSLIPIVLHIIVQIFQINPLPLFSLTQFTKHLCLKEILNLKAEHHSNFNFWDIWLSKDIFQILCKLHHLCNVPPLNMELLKRQTQLYFSFILECNQVLLPCAIRRKLQIQSYRWSSSCRWQYKCTIHRWSRTQKDCWTFFPFLFPLILDNLPLDSLNQFPITQKYGQQQ